MCSQATSLDLSRRTPCVAQDIRANTRKSDNCIPRQLRATKGTRLSCRETTRLQRHALPFSRRVCVHILQCTKCMAQTVVRFPTHRHRKQSGRDKPMCATALLPTSIWVKPQATRVGPHTLHGCYVPCISLHSWVPAPVVCTSNNILETAQQSKQAVGLPPQSGVHKRHER
jgi:hypothetical protein